MSPGSNLGIKQSLNQVSKKSRLHEPLKVKRANNYPDFNADSQFTLSVLRPDLSS